MAPGSLRFWASKSPTLKISWTMHEPFQRIILPAGDFLQILPQVPIGHEQDLRIPAGTRRMISSALPLVTTQSDSALTAAVLLM